MVGCSKYYLKRRQFPGHDGAPEKATTASGHDGAFRPGDAHLDGEGVIDMEDDVIMMMRMVDLCFFSITLQTVREG